MWYIMKDKRSQSFSKFSLAQPEITTPDSFSRQFLNKLDNSFVKAD